MSKRQMTEKQMKAGLKRMAIKIQSINKNLYEAKKKISEISERIDLFVWELDKDVE